MGAQTALLLLLITTVPCVAGEKKSADPHLAVKVTLAVEGMALSDLCDQLRAQTGVQLTAGASVADEKVSDRSFGGGFSEQEYP